MASASFHSRLLRLIQAKKRSTRLYGEADLIGFSFDDLTAIEVASATRGP